MKKLASQWSLSVDYKAGDCVSLPQGHNTEGIDKNKYQCIIYDDEAYPMSEILSNFENSRQGEIGMFYPKKKIIITNDKIFEL